LHTKCATLLAKVGDSVIHRGASVVLSFVMTTTGEFAIATIREEVMRALLLGFLLLAAEPALAAEKYVGSDVNDPQRT
jgi:hypothetical protein